MEVTRRISGDLRELAGIRELASARLVGVESESLEHFVAHVVQCRIGRWQHWAADIRNAPAGLVVDRSVHRGETASDLVHKLQHESTPQVVEAVVEYLRARGRWEAAADTLGIHRNTLRYRVAAAEKLLGVDLADPTPASRLWIALRTAGLTSD